MNHNPHSMLPRQPSAARHYMIHPWLPTAAYEALTVQAARRNLHPEVLAALILDVIATDRLFDAVLDDRLKG